MGTVIDFETGIKTEEPPVECADGHGSSHPFPWVTAIINADNSCFVRTQTGHDSFLDVEISRKDAASLISILASYLVRS